MTKFSLIKDAKKCNDDRKIDRYVERLRNRTELVGILWLKEGNLTQILKA